MILARHFKQSIAFNWLYIFDITPQKMCCVMEMELDLILNSTDPKFFVKMIRTIGLKIQGINLKTRSQVPSKTK